MGHCVWTGGHLVWDGGQAVALGGHVVGAAGHLVGTTGDTVSLGKGMQETQAVLVSGQWVWTCGHWV